MGKLLLVAFFYAHPDLEQVMENRLLFVQPVAPNDTLSDMREAIHNMASGYGCRAILFVGVFNSENESESDSELLAGEPEMAIEEQQQVSYERRKIGNYVLVMTANYPTNDDIAAVRVKISDYVTGLNKLVVVVNDSHGEFSCLAASICAGTVYSIMPDVLDEDREQIYARNISNVANLARISESKAVQSDPSGADAVILVNPREDDYDQYLRHVRMGGIAVFVSTDGTAPFIPVPLQSLAQQSTNSVFSIVRDESRSQ